MTISKLRYDYFEGGAHLTPHQANHLATLFNKMIELAQSWHVALASVFTSAGGGAYEDVTGLSQDVTLVEDGVKINVQANLECEPAAGTAAVNIFRIVIGSDNGDDITIDNQANTDSYGVPLSHSFTGTKGTTYTCKVQVKDDSTTAIKVNKGTIDVTLGAVVS